MLEQKDTVKKWGRRRGGVQESGQKEVPSVEDGREESGALPPWDERAGGDGKPKFLCDIMVREWEVLLGKREHQENVVEGSI